MGFFVKFCIATAAFTAFMLWAADQAGAAGPGTEQQNITVEVEAGDGVLPTVAAIISALVGMVGLEEYVRRRRRRSRRPESPYQMPGESRTEALDRVYRAASHPPPPERRTVQPPLPSNAQARRQERLRRQRGR